MSITKTFKWDTPSTNIIEAFGSLEATLREVADDANLKRSAYHLYTKSGIAMHDIVDIKSALARTGDAYPETVSITFECISWSEQAIGSLKLTVSDYEFTKPAELFVVVEIWGKDTTETYGFMETTKNRVDAEVECLNRLAAPTRELTMRQKIDILVRHPLWSALIAALVAGLIILVLTRILN